MAALASTEYNLFHSVHNLHGYMRYKLTALEKEVSWKDRVLNVFEYKGDFFADLNDNV